MTENPKFENLLLGPKDGDKKERTFLGALRFKSRRNLFSLLGFAALIVLGLIFIRVDQHTTNAVDDWMASREFLVLISRMESGLARA